MASRSPVWANISLAKYLQETQGTGATTIHLESRVQYVSITWSLVASATSDTCVAAPAGWLIDKSVQFAGTVTDASITGSNDGTNYVVLNDPQGNALSSVNAAKIEQILENVLWIKPAVTTGSVTFTLFGRVPVE